MKISVNDKELFNLTDIQTKVIAYDVNADELDADLNRRLIWVLNHKYERCFARLKSEWDTKLKENGITMIPTDPDKYADLVFSQPNYQDRKARDMSPS